MDFSIKSSKPICPYGKPIAYVCTNRNCRQPGIICEEGKAGGECGRFHENCTTVEWSKIEGIINHNPRVCCPDFHYLMDKID